MRRIQRNSGAAVIEVSIPLNLSRTSDAPDAESEDDACFICAHAYCASDACARSMTQLKCCGQALCCSCAVKVCKRCTCSDECEAVITVCPFCREIAPLGTLEVYLGTRAVCKPCTPTPTTPAPSASETPTTPSEPPGE